MKFSVFHPFPTYDAPASTWPVPAKHSRIENLTSHGLHDSLEFARRADEGGIDMVSVAEHHYSSKQLSPNSILAATLVAGVVKNAHVGLLGTTLPLVNPVRIAEEIGMLDIVAKGKLLVGFFRGTPNEFLTYGTNPWESRDVFLEQLELMRACWREPEPFAWTGRHFDYRTVSVWPQPLQAEIPTLITANSPQSATHAARNGYIGGFSFFGPETVAPLSKLFVEQGREAGRDIGPEDMLYRCFALVADTDAQAEEIFAKTRFGDMVQLNKDIGASSAVTARVGAAMAGVPASVQLTGKPKGGPTFPDRPLFIGSPDTVARQIKDFVAATGVGRIEVTINDSTLPKEYSYRSLELYTSEVLPQVRGLDPVALTQESGTGIYAAQPAAVSG